MEIKLIKIRSLKRKRMLIMIMRIFIFLLCTTVFSFNVETGFAQEKVKIDQDKTVTVDEVFDIIIDQTNYSFIYPANLFKDIPKVELKKGEISVGKLLQQSLPKGEFNVILGVGNRITIKEKTETQQQTVSGKVSGQDGMPIPGVAIMVKGTTTGTLSDLEGNFSINVNGPENVLVLSFLGYKTQEVVVGNRTEINVTLIEDVSELDEVVVNGYQKISVNRSTGSTNTLKGEVIDRKANSDLLQSLEGQVAGLGFYSDPTQEGVKKFEIRGVTSLSGDSRPLIIVDGFPIEGPISTINNFEIESVTFLKDAAATSIYGARAANGVVVIVTKKGKSGDLKINVRSFVTTTEKPDLRYRLNRVSSSDLIDIQKAATTANSHTYEYYFNHFPYPGILGNYGAAPNLVYDTMGRLNEGTITQEQADAVFANLRTKDNTAQFEKYFLRAAFEEQHNISVSGGNNGNTFRSSLNYTTNQMNRTGSKSDQVIFDLLNSFKVNENIHVDIAGNVVLNSAKSTPVPDGLLFGGVNSYEDIIDENGNYLPVGISAANIGGGLYGVKDPFEIQRLISAGLLDESYYPLKELGSYTNDLNGLSARLQAILRMNFTKDLSGHLAFQYESGSSKNKRIAAKESFEMLSLINNTTPLSYTGNTVDLNIPLGERITETRANRESYTLRGQLDFNKSFGDHDVSAILGSEIRNVFNSQTTIDEFGYDDNTLVFQPINKKYLGQPISNTYQPGGKTNTGVPFYDGFQETKNRYFSLYGNFSYSYMNKYILSGSARIDQSNLFGTDPKYRYKPFWSVGGKWRVDQESFFKVPLFDKLDLRASYGINGNISNKYGPFNIAKSLLSYRSGQINSMEIITPAILDLRWERTATENFGMDLAVLNSRIGLTLDYYVKKTTDLIANGKANPTQGFSNLVKNDANITNKGIEITLNTENIRTNDFSWSTLFTFRHNKNKVTKSYSDEDLGYYVAGLVNLEGAPANSYWYFNYNGLNEEGLPTIKKANGDILVLNSSFSPTRDVSIEDLINAGSADPIYSGAITNTFTYKDLSLSFMFIGNGGNVLMKDSYNGETISRNPMNINSDAAYAWKNPGDENVTDIPLIKYVNAYSSSVVRRSTKNIIDGDYLKLREVILTYSLNNDFLRSKKIDNILFNLKANNLFYIAKNSNGIDPESQGVGTRFFPVQRSYSLGLTVNF